MHTDLHGINTGRQQSGFAATPTILLGILVLAIVLFITLSNRRLSDDPVPVIWDKTPCASCAMHLGDPRFAAQLSTQDGVTYFYDDPGCLFLHERELGQDPTSPVIYVRWFRDFDQDGWIASAEVAFRRCDDTPMDFGFGAVRNTAVDTVSLEEARAEVLAR